MEWFETLGLMIGSMVLLMMLGVPVVFAFFAVDMAAIVLVVGGSAGLTQIVANGVARVANFSLVPIPLFILMGGLFFRTGLATRVFDAFELLLGRLPGRLAYLTVAGGSFFSALTGSTMANTAMLGSVLIISRPNWESPSDVPVLLQANIAQPSARDPVVGMMKRHSRPRSSAWPASMADMAIGGSLPCSGPKVGT